jgi:ABC-type transporter Mla maintaining outer membrane lipid asymmetry permease subunit MlaE
LFYHKFAASIIYTDRVIPLLAILFDFLALLAGIALCWFCYGL